MESNIEKPERQSARHRRDTKNRIAEVGLALFVKQGFEGTTLDAIAEQSGISRRTFFSYFKSKEDILLAYQGADFADAIRPAILAQSRSQQPIDLAINCILAIASTYETENARIADRLLRSTEALRARKAALFVDFERTLSDAMQDVWQDPQQKQALRTVAMMVMGSVRLALDDWRDDNGEAPLRSFLQQKFALLRKATGPIT